MPSPSVSLLVAAYEKKLPPAGVQKASKKHYRQAPTSVVNVVSSHWLTSKAAMKYPLISAASKGGGAHAFISCKQWGAQKTTAAQHPAYGAQGHKAKTVGHAPSTTQLNSRINALFAQVRAQEKGLQHAIGAATVTSCKTLPVATGHADAKVVHEKGNPLDCVVKYVTSPASGKVVVFNPADSTHRAGGLDVPHFNHSSVPLEEALAVIGAGMKASLDQVQGGYPLGQEHAAENQLYTRGIALRHSAAQLAALTAVQGSGRDRLNAQRDLLLALGAPVPQPNAPRFDMVSIAAVDRRDKPHLDANALESGLRRQLAHGLENAKSAGAKTVVMPLPGSGLFARFSRQPGAKPDPKYLDALARATAWAIKTHGKGLQIVLPSHGFDLDQRIAHHLSAFKPAAMAAAKPVPTASPTATLSKRRMGNTFYFMEAARHPLSAHSPVVKALGPLLGDGSKVSVHRVHGLQAPSAGSQRYWFLGRDPDPTRDRALVSIQVSPQRREVFEVTFSRAALPALAQKVRLAPTL